MKKFFAVKMFKNHIPETNFFFKFCNLISYPIKIFNLKTHYTVPYFQNHISLLTTTSIIQKKIATRIYFFSAIYNVVIKHVAQKAKKLQMKQNKTKKRNAQEVILVNFLAKPYNLKLSSVAVWYNWNNCQIKIKIWTKSWL